MPPVVFLSGVRTGFGAFGGTLKDLSAETGVSGRNTAWFISFAPVDNPQVAVAVGPVVRIVEVEQHLQPGAMGAADRLQDLVVRGRPDVRVAVGEHDDPVGPRDLVAVEPLDAAAPPFTSSREPLSWVYRAATRSSVRRCG